MLYIAYDSVCYLIAHGCDFGVHGMPFLLLSCLYRAVKLQFVKIIHDTSFEFNMFTSFHIPFVFYFQSEGDEEYWQASGAVKMRQTGFNIFDDEMVGRDCANLYNLICQCSRTFLEHVERPPHWP